MSAMTDYLEARFASHIFGTGTFSKPPAIAIALTNAPPDDTDTGASSKEVANAGSYARQAVTQSAANWTDPVGVDGICYNLATITFPQATAAWGNISGALVCTSATYAGGSALVRGNLTIPKDIGANDQLIIAVSGLAFTFA